MGPQSEADAYETLAYRDKRRRQSRSEMASATPRIGEKSISVEDMPGYFGISTSRRASNRYPTAGLPTPASSNLDIYKSMTEPEQVLYTPLTPGTASGASSRRPSSERRQDEREEREMFSKLEKPRVRYDVEVITKLIVYTGTFGTLSIAMMVWLMHAQVLLGSLSKAVPSFLKQSALGFPLNQAEPLDNESRGYRFAKLYFRNI